MPRALLLLPLAAVVAAVDFTDPADGWFDPTAFLRERYGFLPVPIVITEPAVGYGGGACWSGSMRPPRRTTPRST